MLLAFNVLGKWFKNNFWKVLMCDRWGNVCVLVSVNTNTRIRHELEGLQDGLILHGFNNPRSTMTSSEWPNNNHEKFIWLLLLVFFHWAATVKNWGASTKDLGQLYFFFFEKLLSNVKKDFLFHIYFFENEMVMKITMVVPFFKGHRKSW